MPRTGLYVPLDVGFADDDRIDEVGLEGAGLYALSLAVAKRAMTDGHLSRRKLHKLGGTDDLIDRMIDVGLYVSDGRPNGLLRIAAWLDHNDPVSTIEERRARDAARKRVSRAKSPRTSERTPNGRADTVEGSRGTVEGREQPPSSQSELGTRQDRAKDACTEVGTRLHADACDTGVVRSKPAHLAACQRSALTDHLADAQRMAYDHPDWTPTQIADRLMRASVPLEESAHPAIVAQRMREETGTVDAPVADREIAGALATEARRNLAAARGAS
jgi:hypothetical protein